MGIYDREYYRDEHDGANWFSGIAPATRTIIVINIVVWLVQIFGPSLRIEELFALRSGDLFDHYQVWRLLTATFIHSPGNVLHIAWNLLFLFFVGREMESMQGSKEFTWFYIAAAIVSSLGWAITDRMLPGAGIKSMLGASGAIIAVAVVYTLYHPNREILLFFLPVRMWVALAIYLSYDALQFLAAINGRGATGQIAFASHLAGAAFGYLYKVSGLRFSQYLNWGRRGPRLRVVAPDRREPSTSRAGGRAEPIRTSRPMGGASPVNPELLEARLDEVLAKIAREGRASLTEEEKSVLEEASRRARSRRSEKL